MVMGEGRFHARVQLAFPWGLVNSRYVFATHNSLIIFLLTASQFPSGRPPRP